jgi:hypothetical protein
VHWGSGPDPCRRPCQPTLKNNTKPLPVLLAAVYTGLQSSAASPSTVHPPPLCPACVTLTARHPPLPLNPPHPLPCAPQVLFIGLAVVTWWGKALLHIPPNLTWPFNRLLAFPHASNYLEVGAVTVLPWMAVCDRVSALLARVAFPQQTLDLRTKPLSTVQEEPEPHAWP